jgi:hypothetical protein
VVLDAVMQSVFRDQNKGKPSAATRGDGPA